MIYSNITYKTIGFLAICLIATLVSCDKGVEPTANNTISFGISGETRAGEGDNLATFWGYNSSNWVYNDHLLAANITPANGFEANLSTGSVVPTSETFKNYMAENPEYWQADNYHFYSLWPPRTGVRMYRQYDETESEGPGIYFNATATTNPADQLFAYVGIPSSTAVSKTTPVDFEYKHIYSKVIFNVRKNTGNTTDKVILDSLSLSGVVLKGQFSCSNDGVLSCFATANPTTCVICAQAGIELTAMEGGTTINPDGRLMLPQSIGLNAVKVKLVYHFVDAEGTILNSERIEASLPISTIPKWESNKVYTYNIYLAPESNNILFGTPTAATWNQKQGGSTIIIQ